MIWLYFLTVSPFAIARVAILWPRGRVRQGAEVLIGGRVIAGTEPKTVILRARGPSLVDADPNLAGRTVDGLNLTVFDGAGNVLTAGQDWPDHATAMLLHCAAALRRCTALFQKKTVFFM